jgi:hypothetical protein
LEHYFKLQIQDKNYGTGLTLTYFSLQFSKGITTLWEGGVKTDTLGFVVLNTILTIALLTFVVISGKSDNLILSNWHN